jgi:hypothetical protein
MGGARLVAILCPERSGSTLLATLLGGHPSVVAPPELHLLRWATVDEWRAGYPQALVSLRALLRGIGAEDDAERFATWSTPDVYRWILERAPRGGIVVDKTPAYARDARALERLERLRPFYVWLIRHPLGVAASKLERARERRRGKNRTVGATLKYPLFLLREGIGGWSGRAVRDCVAYWVDAHEAIESALGRVAAERRCAVHYEQLVREPTVVLEGLCAALGLAFDAGMLEAVARPAGALAWGIGDEKIRQSGQVDASAAERWRERLDETVLDSRARHLMARLGVG